MQVLMLNTTDIEGGAARAAYRLHQGMQMINVNSRMVVKAKTSDDFTVLGSGDKKEKIRHKLCSMIDYLPLRLYPQRLSSPWSVGWAPSGIENRISQMNPEIVHLHWLGDGFVSIPALTKFNCPLVWTIHDMWPITGGCHYSGDCTDYQNNCGECPQLNSKSENDLTRWIYRRKLKYWKENLNLTAVAPSRWMANCIKSSLIFKDFRVEVIPNGLDIDRFRPIDKKLAREILGLNKDRKLILFGAINAASDPRKGFKYLQDALFKLAQDGWAEKAEAMVFGTSQPANFQMGLKTHFLGKLHDDISLALVYSAADVMLVPSTQESFGQTASEAMACGTPVVAFNTSGLVDIVDHMENGFLAKCFDIQDFAQGIAWILVNDARRQELSRRGREKVEKEFELKTVARRHLELYREILKHDENKRKR